jgi:hypothetical protein
MSTESLLCTMWGSGNRAMNKTNRKPPAFSNHNCMVFSSWQWDTRLLWLSVFSPDITALLPDWGFPEFSSLSTLWAHIIVCLRKRHETAHEMMSTGFSKDRVPVAQLWTATEMANGNLKWTWVSELVDGRDYENPGGLGLTFDSP